MPDNPKQLMHRTVANAAVPYAPGQNPISDIVSLGAGADLIAVIDALSKQGWYERRPGFSAALEGTPTTFSNSVKRLFGWRKWAGSFYVMANEVSGSQSKVYYFQVGTSTSFTLLFTSTSTEPFDFVVSNNYIYFANGTDAKKWDATTLSKWGIESAASHALIEWTAIGVTPGGAVIGPAVNGGWTYSWAWGNSITGHMGSPVTLTTTYNAGVSYAYISVNSRVGYVPPADTQINCVHIFRSTDGGNGVLYELPNSPVALGSYNASWSLNDTALDSALTGTKIYVPSTTNDPAPAIKGVVPYASRIWGFINNTVRFTGFEEIINDYVEEECWPLNNTFSFPDEVIGIAPVADGLLVYTPGRIYKITGDSLDTFRKLPLFAHMGLRQRATLTPVGDSVAWLDSDNTIRVTDGHSVDEPGFPIRSDIATITHASASMTYHTDGKRRFLVLVDGGASKTRVYDIDLQLWMPPWSVSGNAIASIETAAGTWTLLLAHTSGKVLKNLFSAYTDNGSTYTPSATHGLVGLVKDTAGYVGTVEYLSVESDGTQPTTVQILGDEDASTGTFTDITANAQTPGQRTQGTNLKEVWYYARTSPAPSRRIAVKFTWANSSANFKLYGWDIASLPQEQ